MKIARALFAAAAVCTVAAVPAQAAIAAPAHGTAGQARTGTQASTASQGSGRAAFHLPYTDPNQAGLLTLCNKKLQPITHGSINTAPFVWRIVSSVPTPAAWRVKGVTATLFAYQPRRYTPAGAWSGTALTAASVYSNLAHPMVQGTPIDQPLTQMTSNFPPLWDHLIELRVYLGAPDRSPSVLDYGAADLQISGKTWTMVVGGHASCTAGTATSREVLLGLPGANGKPKPKAAGAAAKPSSASSAASTAAASSSASAPAGAGTAASATASDSSSSLAPVGIGAGVLVVVLLAAGGLWRGRRRSRAGL
jgi:hypothetical protein